MNVVRHFLRAIRQGARSGLEKALAAWMALAVGGVVGAITLKPVWLLVRWLWNLY